MSNAGFRSARLMGAGVGATGFFAAAVDEVAAFGAVGCWENSGAVIAARTRSELEMTFIARKV